jgi:hypothetical protein
MTVPQEEVRSEQVSPSPLTTIRAALSAPYAGRWLMVSNFSGATEEAQQIAEIAAAQPDWIMRSGLFRRRRPGVLIHVGVLAISDDFYGEPGRGLSMRKEGMAQALEGVGFTPVRRFDVETPRHGVPGIAFNVNHFLHYRHVFSDSVPHAHVTLASNFRSESPFVERFDGITTNGAAVWTDLTPDNG